VPFLDLVQLVVEEGTGGGLRRDRTFGVEADIGELGGLPGEPPRLLPALPTFGLHHVVVLGEHVQVVRAAGDALTGLLRALGGGGGALARQEVHDLPPQRVGERTERLGIGDVALLVDHVYQDTLLKTS
jgi:hypothetical protein